MFQKIIVFVLFFVTLFFLSQQTIFACSCAARPTVLDSFKSSELVVAAKLVSVEKVREKEGKYDIGYIKSATMVVEKVYKGKVKAGDELIFAQGGGSDCIWTFDEDWIGEKFLFYVDKPSKGHPIFDEEDKDAKPMYYAVTCGRSNALEAANDDLLYLDNLDKLRGKTRISGKLDSWYRNSPNFAGRKVKIIGKDKTYETKTDKYGVYEIYGLPPGEYLIEPEIPKGWKVDVGMLDYMNRYDLFYSEKTNKSNNQFPVVLEKEGHAALDLLFVIDSTIRGKVISPVGKPISGVCIRAVSTELAEGDYRGRFECTDENGVYKIEELSPGNYFLVVNDDGKASSKEPFGTLFYPGVSERKKAGVVAIEAGKFLNDIDIQIPKVDELIEVSGRFLYSDGTPVASDWVDFTPSETNEKTDGKSRAETDAQGRFTIKILKGLRGILSADMYIYESKYENCPEVLKLLEKTGKTSADVKTNEIEISGNENMSDVKLILPFPNCGKKNPLSEILKSISDNYSTGKLDLSAK